MNRVSRIPDDLKAFITLCRAGKLFAVQEWIAAGKPFRLPEGQTYSTSPLRVAMEAGFHSLAEVLLRAGISQREKDRALAWAVWRRGLDYLQLLTDYGANPSAIHPQTVLYCRSMETIHWFAERGMDLETDWPIAHAFLNKRREFFSLYMRVRDRVPTAQKQATMALRVHAREGNLKWVSLLMWAGADPRTKVPDLLHNPPEQFMGTALVDALQAGREEVVRKIRLNPSTDDLTELLEECAYFGHPNIVKMLIDAGADPTRSDIADSIMESLIAGFESALDGSYGTRTPEAAIACIEIVASAGGRWRIKDPMRLRYLRTALAKAKPHSAIRHLGRLIDCGVMDQPIFAELMSSPKMVQLLKTSAPGAVRLRQFAARPTSGRQSKRLS